MPTREEMLRGIKFNQDRATKYKKIADEGGNETMTREQAQAAADQFTGYAAQLATSLAARQR